MDCPKCVERGTRYLTVRQEFEQGEWWCQVHGTYYRYPPQVPERMQPDGRKAPEPEVGTPRLTEREREWLRRTL
jgi:hypothetical protein